MDLLQQVEQMSSEEFPDLPQAEQEEILCAGDYRRRSPVQGYFTPPGYRRRLVGRCVLAVLAVLIAALAVYGLFQSGLLRF